MYIFVFIWVPTLQESSTSPASLPLGIIFSSFMVSMMIGSLFYTFITSSYWHQPQAVPATPAISTPHGRTVVLHAKLSSLVCALSAFAFAACVHEGMQPNPHAERVRFWSFCLFEACVGLYYPVQGMLRGALIANDQRATASSF